VAWDSIERRRSGEHGVPLPKVYTGLDKPRKSTTMNGMLLDPETGFFTMPTLTEFIQYEIDGSAQTLRNELHVTPLCLAAVDVGQPPDVAEVRQKFWEAVHGAVRQVTRTSDRVAREGDQHIMLLRRSMAASLREHFAPRLTETINSACADFGVVTVSLGIASLVEHVAKSPGHLVRMAQRALEESRTTGVPVVYDFRTMLVT